MSKTIPHVQVHGSFIADNNQKEKQKTKYPSKNAYHQAKLPPSRRVFRVRKNVAVRNVVEKEAV